MARTESKLKEASPLPDEVFHVLAALFPDFIRIANSCQLNGIELFTLWYMKNRGTAGDFGQWIILRKDFTKLFEQTLDYTSNDVNQHLDRLERKGLVLRRRITAAEGQRRVRSAAGEEVDSGAVVAILPEGLQRLEQVKKSSNQLVADKVAGVPLLLRKMFLKSLPTIVRVAGSILRSLDPSYAVQQKDSQNPR